jgi:GTPase
LEELKTMLRPGPAFFEPDTNTDQSEPFLVSEIIREKIYLRTRQELPYSAAVTVSHIEEVPEKDLLTISAKIHVETESQKGILIGSGGKMIKAVGQDARKDLESFFGVQVYLDLTVRVDKNWSRDPKVLRNLVTNEKSRAVSFGAAFSIRRKEFWFCVLDALPLLQKLCQNQESPGLTL